MANEVEIVITGKNKARPAVDAAKKDAEGLGRTYRETGRASTTALSQIQDKLRGGLRGALVDVRGETSLLSRAFRSVQEGATRSLDAASSKIKAGFTRIVGEREGRSMGQRVAAGLDQGFRSAGNMLGKGLKGALSAATSKPVLLGAAVGIGAVLSPALATAVSGGLIMGIGAGLVGVGVKALTHVEEIDKKWSKSEQKRVAESNKQAEKIRRQYLLLGRDVMAGLKAASQPLIPVLDTVRSTVRSVGREFRPVIESAMKIAAGPLRRFVRSLGEAFVELKPSLEPLMTAFGAILDEVGPQLPGLFQAISDALIGLATTAVENRDLIALVFAGMITTIPLVIDLLSTLTGMFRGVLVTSISMADGIVGALQSVMEGIAAVPGPWQESARQMAESLQGTRAKLQAWRQDIEDFPKQVKLEGEISDLEAKISEAKRRLRDPKLTRPQKAKIRAEIADLQAAVARAKSALASIQDRHVNIFVKNTITTWRAPMKLPGQAHGGIISGLGMRRFASGGVAGAGSLAMVGEQGPEVVRLPVGSTVVPAGQTRAMQSSGGGGGGGFGSMSMAFRPGGGLSSGGLADVVEPLREVAKTLREIVSLRDGMSKLTSNIFGQERALSAYEAAWDAARKSLKDNKKTLSLTSEKGRENRAALLSLAESAQEVVASMREVGRSSTSIVKKMAEQRREFIKMARSMGLTSAQAKRLADRYGLIPKKVKTILTEEKKDISYNRKAERYNKKLEKKQAAAGRASGGPGGGWTMVGEQGPELLRLPFGSSVTAAGQTAAMLAGGGGGGRTVLEIKSGGSKLDDLLLELLRRSIRTRGGNVQLVLGRG